MTSSCFQRCFSKNTGKVHPVCFEACYSKYLLTIREACNSLKEYGYKRQSVYAYKAFPEDDEWFEIIYSSNQSILGPTDGMYIEMEYLRTDRKR